MTDRVLYFRFDRKTPERLDKFLVGQLQEFSRSRIQGLITDGFVDVNGRAAKKAGQTLESGFSVTVRVPPTAPTNLVAEDIPLDIIFENEDLIVVNKPAGMVVHPGSGNYTGTLLNGRAWYLQYQNPGINEATLPRFGLVHRIDKNTSGLMVLAKTEKAVTCLAKEFFDHTIHRQYIAMVWGDVAEDAERVERQQQVARERDGVRVPGPPLLAIPVPGLEIEVPGLRSLAASLDAGAAAVAKLPGIIVGATLAKNLGADLGGDLL